MINRIKIPTIALVAALVGACDGGDGNDEVGGSDPSNGSETGQEDSDEDSSADQSSSKPTAAESDDSGSDSASSADETGSSEDTEDDDTSTESGEDESESDSGTGDNEIDCSNIVESGVKEGEVPPNLEITVHSGEKVELHQFCNQAVFLVNGAMW